MDIKFEQGPGVDDGQGRLACFGPQGHKESDTTEDWNAWVTRQQTVRYEDTYLDWFHVKFEMWAQHSNWSVEGCQISEDIALHKEEQFLLKNILSLRVESIEGV